MKISKIILTYLFLSCALLMTVSAQSDNGKQAKEIKKPGYFSKARFETNYDKFKDRTTVKFKPLPLTGGVALAMRSEMISLIAGFVFKGQAMTQPVDSALIGFQSSSKEWIFLKSNHFIALVDGERIDLGDAERDSEVRLGEVSELLLYKISFANLQKLALANKVEVQVGNREFAFKDHHLYALRELANKMQAK